MQLLRYEPRETAIPGLIEIYNLWDVSVYVKGSGRIMEDAERFGRLSGRPPELYYRRLARRISETIGLDGPVTRRR